MSKQENIDVSISMLTYNHEKYVAQALDSILMQKTSLRYEIFVGDDASGDKTPEIIREYAARYPEVIRPILREKNLGTTNNGHDLRQRMKGTYIASLEGDDFWLDPEKLQRQYEFLERNPEYIACCGKCVIVDENGTPDYTKTPGFVWNKKVFTLADYLDRWKIPGHASTTMSRNFFREMAPEKYEIMRTASPSVGDKTMALIRLSRGPIYCENRIVSAYRCVNKKDGGNYFSRHYANPYRNHDMFLYSCNLEDWARKELGLRAEIGWRQKKTRFCRFVEECVREPSPKRLQYLAEMIARSHAPGKYTWYLWKTLIEME